MSEDLVRRLLDLEKRLERLETHDVPGYETGIWTPTITYTTPGTLSVTYAGQSGQYTKIGRQVTVNFDVVLSAFTKGTASGYVVIGGLPFTVNATIGGYGVFACENAPFTDAPFFAYAGANTTLIYLLKMVNNSAWATLDDPDANSHYYGIVTYFV